MKRPSFQFYPGDWLNDAGLRLCSVGARGLWIEMICLMHQGSNYGSLKVNHTPILPINLARISGATICEVEGWLLELETAGVFSRDEDGCIFSRRMISDEKVRVARAAGGILGGNPSLVNGSKGSSKVGNKVNHLGNLTPTPSSSSSSSSINTPLTPKGEDLPGFANFWKTWPVNDRKQAKGKCLDAWKKASAERDAALILAHVERMKSSEDWRKQSGQFVPAPLVYLNQRRWEGASESAEADQFFAGAI